MRFQKILILISLIVAALSFVYALSFCGGTIYQYQVFYNPSADTASYEGVLELVHASQSYNDILIWLSIVFILVVVLNYIMATNKRRNYYVTNYVSIILTVVYAVVFAALIVVFVINTYSLFVLVDRVEVGEAYEFIYGEGNFKYTTINFILGYVMAGVIVIDATLLVFNLVWKVKLMKGEKKLLEASAVQSEQPAAEEGV